jgi:hypothetical protein
MTKTEQQMNIILWTLASGAVLMLLFVFILVLVTIFVNALTTKLAILFVVATTATLEVSLATLIAVVFAATIDRLEVNKLEINKGEVNKGDSGRHRLRRICLSVISLKSMKFFITD